MFSERTEILVHFVQPAHSFTSLLIHITSEVPKLFLPRSSIHRNLSKRPIPSDLSARRHKNFEPLSPTMSVTSFGPKGVVVVDFPTFRVDTCPIPKDDEEYMIDMEDLNELFVSVWTSKGNSKKGVVKKVFVENNKYYASVKLLKDPRTQGSGKLTILVENLDFALPQERSSKKRRDLAKVLCGPRAGQVGLFRALKGSDGFVRFPDGKTERIQHKYLGLYYPF